MSSSIPTTQPATEPQTAAWYVAAIAGALKLGQKALDFWRFRASVEARMSRRLEASLQHRLADLDARINTLEGEKTALQAQNGRQQARIEALERELAADKELRHKLRGELQQATFERDAARSELGKRGK